MKTLDEITSQHSVLTKAVTSWADNYNMATSDSERKDDEGAMKKFVQDHISNPDLQQGYYQLFDGIIGRKYE